MSERASQTSLRAGLLIIALALALVSPAHAAGVFTIAGGGSRPLREGAIAGTANITDGGDVAADPGGGFAFIDGSMLWRVGTDGRAHALRLPADVYASRIAYGPDGALYAGAGDAVWRIGRDGAATVIAGDPDTPGYAGDGGPATAARLTRPGPATFDHGGGLLVIDDHHLIRRITADGTITTVASSRADVSDVAAAPDGTLYLATADGVLELSPGGVTTTIGPAVHALALLADGALAEVPRESARAAAWVVRFGPGSLRETLLRPSDRLGFDVWNGCDVFGSDSLITHAIDVAPDGGLLISGGAAIQYVPAPGSGTPAAAITSAKLTRDARVRVALRLTVPAAVRVTVWKGTHAIATAEAPPEGVAPMITLNGPIDPALHRITVQARPSGAAGPVAAAESLALLARSLPIAVTRSLADHQSLLLASFEDLQVDIQPCRRMGSRRVDCPGVVGKHCAGVLSMTWERDGHLTWIIYGAGRGACRISAGRGVPDVRRHHALLK